MVRRMKRAWLNDGVIKEMRVVPNFVPFRALDLAKRGAPDNLPGGTPFASRANSGFEVDPMAPAERVQLGDVEKPARSTIGF